MKHAKKEEKPKKKRKKKKKKNIRKKRLKQLKVLLVLLVLAIAGAGITIYLDYQARPGFLEKIWIADRGADYITVAWERVRNVDKYVVTYNGTTIKVGGREKNVSITGLNEDTEYKITVRADSKEREGFETLEESARTKKSQTIQGEDRMMKFLNWPVDMRQTAATDVTYLPGSGYRVNEDGTVSFTRSGEITVTARAAETEEYAGVSKEITVQVLNSVSVKPDGAKPHIFYKLNRDNCQCVRSIEGADNAMIPQAFVHAGGRYIVSYIKDDSLQRLVAFGDKKQAYTPGVDLGHANGLTLADGYCYSVRGGTSLQCITFDTSNNNYGILDLAYDASGIAFDEKTGMLFTSSRRQIVAYDGNLKVLNRIGRVARKTKFYVQDCAAYGGILMQGVSGAGYTGTNYIDFYDMTGSKYIGSIECELGEIESIIVDEEGYIEVLGNIAGPTDYIWKTPVNMKKLCD